jgi:hypothetical protein
MMATLTLESAQDETLSMLEEARNYVKLLERKLSPKGHVVTPLHAEVRKLSPKQTPTTLRLTSQNKTFQKSPEFSQNLMRFKSYQY